jgi:uncharacterized membrane protein
MSKKLDPASVAAALAGAVEIALLTAPASAAIEGMEKCYGIATAGQNSCSSAAGAHACAGQATVDYSGEEWRVVKEGVCEGLGGKLQPFEGIDTEAERMGSKPKKM